MGTINTTFPTSLKKELPKALHDWTAVTGHDFLAALIKPAPTGNYGAATTNYSDLTGNSDEVLGTGYTIGGYDFTAAENIDPDTVGTTAFWGWSINPSWVVATFTTAGVLIYNADSGDRAVYTGYFGATQTVVAGTFTILMPATDEDDAILRLL